jgi:DNA-binding Lrp family transcriptional regulator
MDRRLIARLCGDIDESLTPFATLASETGLPEMEVLSRLRHYREVGAMRRFGAVLRQTQAGFPANGLSLWQVPAEDRTRVAALLSAHPAITHCYERPSWPDWPFSLYAMLHAHSHAECQAQVDTLAARAGVTDYQLLFSRREYKKTSMIYFTEEW